MILKNNTTQHVQIPGTSISLRPWRTKVVPEGKYELPKGIVEIKKESKVKKIYKKGDDE